MLFFSGSRRHTICALVTGVQTFSLPISLAFGVGVASIAPLLKRNLRRTPLFTWGMVIAHLGVAVSLAGMASESAFNKEELIAARPGDKVRIADWTVTFDSIDRKSVV